MSDKRIITDDHRKNYVANNKSDIFFATGKKEEAQVNHKAMLKDKRTKSDFVPNFKDETAFNKKVKEFYNKESEKKIGSSQGYLETEKNNNNAKPVSNLISTPKERKLFQLNPNIKEDTLKTIKNRKNNFFERNSTASKFDNNKESQENRNMNLISNIFNDPEKAEFLEKVRTQSQHVKSTRGELKKKEEEEKAKLKQKIPKTEPKPKQVE
jgi:hypothetical protein